MTSSMYPPALSALIDQWRSLSNLQPTNGVHTGLQYYYLIVADGEAGTFTEMEIITTDFNRDLYMESD